MLMFRYFPWLFLSQSNTRVDVFKKSTTTLQTASVFFFYENVDLEVQENCSLNFTHEMYCTLLREFFITAAQLLLFVAIGVTCMTRLPEICKGSVFA